MSYTLTERFEVARVLSRMAGVLSRNFRVLAILALTLSGLPAVLAGSAALGLSGPFGATAGGPLLGLLLVPFTSTLLQAALIHGTVSDLNGRPATIGDCLNTAVRHVLPLIGVTIATTVASFAGFVLFIIPGVIIALTLCVSAPVRVVEGRGVFDSLGRSGELTRGHRWAILLLVLLNALIAGAVQAATLSVPLALTTVTRGSDSVLASLVIAPITQSFSALISAAGVASVYFELRTIKEGVGIEALAAAFD